MHKHAIDTAAGGPSENTSCMHTGDDLFCRCSGNPGNQSYSFDFHPVVTPLGVHCKLLQTCFHLLSNTPIDLVFPENLPSHFAQLSLKAHANCKAPAL